MCNIIGVETKDNLEYVFFPVTSGALRLRVKAMNDAHIALTKGDYESDPMTEIHIGGWDNTKSIVRRDRNEPDKVKVDTPNILNRNRYVSMWIQWYSGYIAAGLEGSITPFISYNDNSPHAIDHFAVRTGWGSTGSWRIEVSPVQLIPPTIKKQPDDLRWVRILGTDPIPSEAVIGGFEDGELVYIARAPYRRSLCPGKFVPSLKKAFIPFGNEVYETDIFEVLCGFNLMWVRARVDRVPPNAYPGGDAPETANEKLYIGRALLKLDLIPGKVHLHYKRCFLPYGDMEHEVSTYEVLVVPDTNKNIIWFPPRPRIPDRDGFYD